MGTRDVVTPDEAKGARSETVSWFEGWAAAMQRLSERSPEEVRAAQPPRQLPSGKPSRMRVWLEGKAAKMMAVTQDMPVAALQGTSEPSLEPGRWYEPAEPQKTTEDQLRYAIRAYGRTSGARAHWYLGSAIFEAIPTLGEEWNWAWVCQQPLARIPWVADRLDQRLGRRARRPVSEPSELVRDSVGGGQYGRNLTEAPPVLLDPNQARQVIREELNGRVNGYDFWVDCLTDKRLTAGDWRRIIGEGLKRAEQKKLRYSLRVYLDGAALAESRKHKQAERQPEDSGDPDDF